MAAALGAGDAASGTPNEEPTAIVPWLIAVFAVAAVGGAGFMARRRRLSPATPIATPSADVASARVLQQPSAASMHDLLDISRRLTAAAATGDVDRLVVRHALDLVVADGAALVRHNDGTLAPSAQSHVDLIVANGLTDSALTRVAETGQAVVQVSASDPAIRNVPCALAAVPLVGGGRVLAVLAVVRTSSRPFTIDERHVLEALAPVAAAAMHSASQSRAAIEDSLSDPLTGVGNRRRFDNELARVLTEEPGPTSLIMVDLDHFKTVNDTHGHPAGDAVLKRVAALLRTVIRPGDTAYRFGGEEFCVLLPDTDEGRATDVAERLRGAIESTPIDIGGAEPLHRTASFGVASTTAAISPDELLARADAALYRAKEGGRNRVSASGSP
jgi:diguanylate cyclase (GGDEF)-like protein